MLGHGESLSVCAGVVGVALFSVAEFAAGGAAVAACAGAFDGPPDFAAAVSVDDDVDFVGGGGVLCSHGDLFLSTGGRTFALPIFFRRGGWGEKPAHGNDGATHRPDSFRGSAATALRKVFGALAVVQRSEGLSRRARVMQYRREPDVRQEIRCLLRCGAQRSSVRGTPAGWPAPAGRRNARPFDDAGGVATSHLRTSAGRLCGSDGARPRSVSRQHRCCPRVSDDSKLNRIYR